MFQFNDTNILTGYIKEMLASFNLPKYRIYTRENLEYFKQTGTESPEIISSSDTENFDFIKVQTKSPRFISYIKDGEIQQYVNGKWKSKSKSYIYNRFVPNETRNYTIKNNIYDYYTHEYLGDYLRFLRDYHNVNLMPLYNCFSDHICNNVEFTVKGSKFSGTDSAYKIYVLPVKLFKKYTIAIDCRQKYEVCCAMYNKYLNTSDKFEVLPELTYKKIDGQFNKPVIYDLNNLLPSFASNTEDAVELAQNEGNLKLFLKLPASNTSSIVILEGDYLNWNDQIITYFNKKANKAVINFDAENWEETSFKPITKLQLLEFNTGKSYPFADRLIEYLLGNVVTPLDEISDNIKRVQTIANQQAVNKEDKKISIDGIWTTGLQKIIYSFMNSDKVLSSAKKDTNHDILGYTDKDVENSFRSADETLLDVDLYKNEKNTVIEEAR